MANNLNEETDALSEDRDVRVINKKVEIKVGPGSKVFEVLLWILGIIPGIVFLILKIQAKNKLDQLEQRLQSDASTVDNYLENRVVILKNCASLLEKSINLDKDVYTEIAAFRSGVNPNQGSAEANREALAGQVETFNRNLNMAFERYPELRAQDAIMDAMRQNNTLQREVSAAREKYNNDVSLWNRLINQWPTYMIVAAKNGYTTRIPFSTSQQVREEARGNFFD